ncbi:BTB/POZ domain-containing protein At3g05675-like [Corylus avellana]|uniref:BTB/POZ domain-containing protein At3g05675-like n=1 Tax=Corylus avellana TaxID=13451 RepID=UPI001E1FC350|nr:BTB/POZ domain-containing protein At3g05675-like [Corylus avellana]
MVSPDNETRVPGKIGDRSASDVVVRLRTQDGRDDWIYCHSHILIEKSKYFADRLSENWPTCQVLDSRNCVEVYCHEPDFDYYVNVVRLLYAVIDGSMDEMWHGVRNALGILQVAVKLGCPQIVTACVKYLEAVPWEDAEEEEILRIIPRMGLQTEPILARLQPINPSAIMGVFLSGLQFATSSPPPMNYVKISAQKQLKYMITEDGDAPLLTADDEIKLEVKECVKRLLSRFNNLLEALLREPVESVCGPGIMSFQSYLSDLIWACQILDELEIMSEFVNNWIDASDKIVKFVEQVSPIADKTEITETRIHVIVAVARVWEAIGCGTVILPTEKRLHAVKVWLPFVRVTKPFIDSVITNSDGDGDGDNALAIKIGGELWQYLESTLVSIIVALPSENQAEILTEWLGNEHIQYPDLTVAFEVWCYRFKVARRRLSLVVGDHGTTNTH